MHPRRVPSATDLNDADYGQVVLCGSHGGLYPAAFASRTGVRAIVFNDAGIGRDGAGIAGVAALDRAGIAAATVSYASARIGDPDDMEQSGVISRCNRLAANLGVVAGMRCSEALERLAAATPPVTRGLLPVVESRLLLAPETATRHPIVLLDSASLADAARDRDAILVTGSHGGLVGGRADRALAAEAFAAVFNDAGIGKDSAGVARLAALEGRRILAFTVAAQSARIGDARSTLEDGIISAVNPAARRAGAEAGNPARAILEQWSRGAGTR